MSDQFKTPGCGTFIIILAVLAAAGFGGWRGYLHYYVGPRNARIQELSILATGHLDMMLLFEKALPAGDPKDVRVELSSESLKAGALVLPWSELAPVTMTRTSRLDPGQPPPLGVPLQVRMPVGKLFEERMTLSAGSLSNFKLTAKLFWGGTQQDRTSTTVLFNYPAVGT
jgi:hypothetical protein